MINYNKTEFYRKLVHMTVGVVMVMLIYLGYLNAFILFWILCFGIILSFACKRYHIPVIYWILDKVERKHVHPGKGAITYLVGCILALKLFPSDIAYASILVLALGDGITTVIGPLGKTYTILSNKKLLEGTLAGIILATWGASFFIPLYEALLAGTLAMTLEATEIKMNNKILSDNILVPLVAGTTVLLIRTYI